MITSTVQVVTPPYEIVLVDEAALSTPAPKSDSTALIVVGIVVPVLIVSSLVVAYIVNRSDHSKNQPTPMSVMSARYPAYMQYRQVPVRVV